MQPTTRARRGAWLLAVCLTLPWVGTLAKHLFPLDAEAARAWGSSWLDALLGSGIVAGWTCLRDGATRGTRRLLTAVVTLFVILVAIILVGFYGEGWSMARAQGHDGIGRLLLVFEVRIVCATLRSVVSAAVSIIAWIALERVARQHGDERPTWRVVFIGVYALLGLLVIAGLFLRSPRPQMQRPEEWLARATHAASLLVAVLVVVRAWLTVRALSTTQDRVVS